MNNVYIEPIHTYLSIYTGTLFCTKIILRITSKSLAECWCKIIKINKKEGKNVEIV